jgi:hypothetical protein
LGSVHVLHNGDDFLMQYNGPIVRARCIHRAILLFLPRPPKHIYVTVIMYS